MPSWEQESLSKIKIQNQIIPFPPNTNTSVFKHQFLSNIEAVVGKHI